MKRHPNKASILIVDSEKSLHKKILDFFCKTNKYESVFMHSSSDLVDRLDECEPDVIVLEESCTDILGTIREIRNRSYVGIIVMASTQNKQDIKIETLNAGADEFFEKPWDLNYFQAKLDQVARRIIQINSIQDLINQASPKWRFFAKRWLLVSPDNVEIELTATEHTILQSLFNTTEKPISRREIAKLLRRDRCDNYEFYVNTLVSRLRKKIQSQSSYPFTIKACRGLGYIITTEVELI